MQPYLTLSVMKALTPIVTYIYTIIVERVARSKQEKGETKGTRARLEWAEPGGRCTGR